MSDTTRTPEQGESAHSEGHGSANQHGSDQPHGSVRIYLAIWAALVTFTAITVTMASLNLGTLAIIAVLTIAATKSILVLFYFMHLWWEKKLIIKLLIPIVLVTLAIFIGLTYTDILYR